MKNKGETAYDKNKQYTNILMNCDKYGWSQFAPTDEVKDFDGTIDTGTYFIETSISNPVLEDNGWYFDYNTMEKVLKYKLITNSNIKFQVKASYSLSPDHFEKFVHDVYDTFEPTFANGGKSAINGFIGSLGNSTFFKKLKMKTIMILEQMN